MSPFTYAPDTLGYYLGPKPLSKEEQHKLKLIENINTIQQKLGKGVLTTSDFDRLWDEPLNRLMVYVNDQAAFLASSHIY